MYSREGAGAKLAGMWKEPKGLNPGQGLTAEIARKFIMHSIKAVNKYIENNRYIKHMGPVGSWAQRDINRLVLPTAGEMIGEEEQSMNDIVAKNVITEAIMGEITN